MDKFAEIRVPIAHDNPSIKRKDIKCVLCGKCKDVCKKQMGVAGAWKYDSEDIVCINCGQCANFCPVEAITEQDDTPTFEQMLTNPKKKLAVIVAPAVRVSLGEMFDMPAGEIVTQKIVGALKNLGVDYVFDVAFGADLTVMEEANEFISRIKSNTSLPQFTSCCPAWVKFIQTFYPQFSQNLSTCKSPIAMEAAVIKNCFAKTIKTKPSDLCVVALTPCVAKKMEVEREDLTSTYGRDTNLVITAREFARFLKRKGIDLNEVEPETFDEPFSNASGAGVKFGASGGVMNAVVGTAFYLANQKPMEEELQFKPMRGFKGVKTAQIQLFNKPINLCVVFGTNNVRKLIEKDKLKNFQLVEVMACPNGCVGGGGQPRQANNKKAVNVRGNKLFLCGDRQKATFSYQNPQIVEFYKNNQDIHSILHTKY